MRATVAWAPLVTLVVPRVAEQVVAGVGEESTEAEYQARREAVNVSSLLSMLCCAVCLCHLPCQGLGPPACVCHCHLSHKFSFLDVLLTSPAIRPRVLQSSGCIRT